MKKNTLTILFFLLSVLVVYSQSVIENPKTGLSLNSNSKITKIELTDSTTILCFHTFYTPYWWINIPKETYIQPIGCQKLFIKRTEGIPLNERYTMPASGEVNYKLIFPAIAKTTNYIDYGEANEGGSWFIYDIAVNPLSNKLRLPNELYGNWFNKLTGDWELSFNENYAVYKNQLWSYEFSNTSKGLKTLKLTPNNGKSIVLYIKYEKLGTYLFGESALELKSYCKNSVEAQQFVAIDNKAYELPIFKLDSATYSGYIKGYTPRVGVKTLSICTDDIISGKQTIHVIKISENGFFTVKLPIYYPHFCWVGSSIYNGLVFLEPGKMLFQMIDPSNLINTDLFMGESAQLNSDLTKLMKINSFDFKAVQNIILGMSPTQYKTYCNSFETRDLNTLDSIKKSTKLSEKAYEVMKLEIRYRTVSNIMGYKNIFEYAYCEKNKIPRTQRDLPIKIDSLSAEYFDFINDELLNNPLAVVAPSYGRFINSLKYLDILRIANTFSINTQGLVAELKKSGYRFTESEKLMLDKLNEMDSISNLAEQKNFNEKYGKQIIAFYTKYQENIKIICKNTPKADNTIVYKYFKDNKIKLTVDEKKLWKAITKHDNDEKKLWKAINKHDNSENSKKIYEFYTTYGDSTNAFNKRHSRFINELFDKKKKESRNESLKSIFNIQPGLGMDIMLAQDNCNKIVEELSPVSNEKLQIMQQQFLTPFIADYIAFCNNQAFAKLEANKKKTGFVLNETPKTDATKIFDAIIKKYKGKVIYVDFWATWCSPCREGIKQIKPLKEDFKDKDIVFLYITDESSPIDTWNKLIPDIKGEHYRVSSDEWTFLKSMFNISGIPHYALVGKTGEVINWDLVTYDNIELKAILEKYIQN